MTWLKDNRRDAAFILLTLAVPVFAVLYLLISLLGMRASYQGEIDRLAPRIARLEGLLSQESVLQDSAGRVDSQVLNLVYPVAEDRAAVSASLQKNVRDILSDAGMAITNSQILPVEEEDGFDQIAIKVTVSGDLASLDTALADIAAYRPLLLVESMDVWPNRATRRGQDVGQTVTVGLQLLALRQAL